MIKKYKMTLILEDLETGQIIEPVKDRIVNHVQVAFAIPHKPIQMSGNMMPLDYELDGDVTIDISAKWNGK